MSHEIVDAALIDQLAALIREITPRTPGPCDPVRAWLEQAVRDIGERLSADHTLVEMAAIIDDVAARSSARRRPRGFLDLPAMAWPSRMGGMTGVPSASPARSSSSSSSTPPSRHRRRIAAPGAASPRRNPIFCCRSASRSANRVLYATWSEERRFQGDFETISS